MSIRPFHSIAATLRKFGYRRAPEGQPFKLASGGTSDHYTDVRAVALRPDGAWLLGAALYDVLNEGRFGAVASVAGVVLGGCPLATATSTYAFSHGGLFLPAIYVRPAPKAHGTGKLVEIPTVADVEKEPLTPTVLLEDVVTSGKSSIAAATALEKAGIHVAGILAVVDRREKRDSTLGKWMFHSLTTLGEILNVKDCSTRVGLNGVLYPA